jgi:hypothetical protein
VSAVAPAPALTTPPRSQSYTPSVRSTITTAGRSSVATLDTASNSVAQHGGAGISLEAMVALLDKQHDRMEERMEKQHEKMERLRREFEERAKTEKDERRLEMERAKTEREALQHEMEKRRDAQLRGDQLLALQSRLEVLHLSKLLTDTEMYKIEDIIVDGGETETDERVDAMLSLSSRVVANAAFARQLRRKYG